MNSSDVKPSNPANIKGAAMRYGGVIFWMPPPFRHGHVGHAYVKSGFTRDGTYYRMEQGFISQDDKFLDRKQAAAKHFAAGGRLHWPPRLYSEDLW